MIKYIYLFSLIFVFSCSKVEKKQKRLQGNWKVQVVRIEDGEGFMFYDSAAVGNFSFEQSQISGAVKYSYSYFGQYFVNDSVQFTNTAFWLSSDATHIEIARPTDTLNAKIIMLTKKHLTFEYYDYLQYRLKRFSLEKS
jgi:hypothetical protein